MSERREFVGHVRLEDLHCKKANFEQLFVPSGRLAPDLPIPMKVSLGFRDTGDGPVAVEFSLTVQHDRDAGQPYNVEVVYVGRFGIGDLPEGLTRENFARTNAAAIMFPFVRATIADITMRGSVGPLVLPPVNVVAMLQESRREDEVPA